MYSQVHVSRALYKSRPTPGNRYLNFVIVEKQQFEVRILEGGVEKIDPESVANSSDARNCFSSDAGVRNGGRE